MVKSAEVPFKGSKRGLVISFDVGTTYSAISYALLDPGEVPKVQSVTHFPGQEDKAGSAKIPSVLVYDKNGNVLAAGAEAETAAMIAKIEEEEDLVRVEWFKLQLRPKNDAELGLGDVELSPLPHGKGGIDVFADYVRYLFTCAEHYISQTHANGPAIWAGVKDEIHFVFTLPNGWSGGSMQAYRRAAIAAGLIPPTNEGKSRIRFVTEGEASLHSCVDNGLADDFIQEGSGFIIADLGGGTLDMSAYEVVSLNPFRVRESAAPECRVSGSVLVSRRAKVMFQVKLKPSPTKYGTPSMIDHITRKFDETTKRTFKDSTTAQFVAFGTPKDKDPKLQIAAGKLKLTGAEVARLFDPSVSAAEEAIRAQHAKSPKSTKAVFLVGGFATSPYMFTQLTSKLKSLGIQVSRPDGHESKAVANGAIGFYLDQFVSARVSKFTYGVKVDPIFNPANPEHTERESKVYEHLSGTRYVKGGFECMLPKDTAVSESGTFTYTFCDPVKEGQDVSARSTVIYIYKGNMKDIRWVDLDPENFSRLCVVKADFSTLRHLSRMQQGPSGAGYHAIEYDVVINFGRTEFTARVRWNENGHAMYSPAAVVFDDDGIGEVEEPPSLNTLTL